jgi:acyl-CoA synthetase (AMP-forming)/AMP-acid ligase II/uncharacterized membrane protein
MRFDESILVRAPRPKVWELLRDPTRWPAVLDWVTRLDPEDPDDPAEPGCRARYDMRVHVGSAEVGGLVELIEYDEQRDIVWTSITGVTQRGRLRLRDAEGGCTRVTLKLAYDAPGALLGTVAELIAAPQIAAAVRRGLESIKAEAEGGPRRADDGPALARAGLVAPMRPDKVARIALAGARWGASPATGVIVGAIRHPDRTMLVDDLGQLTYAEVHRRSNAIARGLADAGIRAGDRVGLMCRDHRGFVESVAAIGKLGADVLLLNTSFAAPQIAEVAEREGTVALIYDEEFAKLVREAGRERTRFVAWHEGGRRRGGGTAYLGDLAESGDTRDLSPPDQNGHVTILTSGTTGTPKGATRSSAPLTLDPPAALLERMPLREGLTVRMGAPLFHAWGFSNLLLGMALGATFVLRRRFDAERCLADLADHRCEALVVVPVMLQRILELPEGVRARYDTSALRAVCASGSALPGDLALRWMDAFGDTLYNLYGSTEVSAATIATPRDMRRAPGTAGRPARGSIVRLYDEHGKPVLQGDVGRIFVGNALLFDGYTGGGSKDVIDGLMATGDVGRFDEAGRLFVHGRDDEMIVSGGENVFPKEVEDVLSRHDGVAEAAAIGVEDEQFGQRLRAFVVRAGGARVGEDELKAHVREQLARYKVPREVVFVDELPRTSTGKVLKRELAERG